MPRTGCAVLVGVPAVLETPTADALGRTYDRVVVATDQPTTGALPDRSALFVLSCLTGRHEPRPFLDVDPGRWWSDVESRLSTTFAWARVAATALTRTGGGRIVLLVDQAGVLGETGTSAQATTSSAAMALTKSLGRELAPRGISVNAAALSAAATTTRPDGPARVAQTVAFLADHRLPRLVGQIVTCAHGDPWHDDERRLRDAPRQGDRPHRERKGGRPAHPRPEPLRDADR